MKYVLYNRNPSELMSRKIHRPLLELSDCQECYLAAHQIPSLSDMTAGPDVYAAQRLRKEEGKDISKRCNTVNWVWGITEQLEV